MKRHTNILRLFLISLVLAGIITACEGPAGPKGDKGEPGTRYFTFYFNVGRQYATNKLLMGVNFFTSDLSAIPEVIVNGVTIENFSIGGGAIQGHIYDLQYSSTVNYRVSVSGETTSGSIDIPTGLSDVMCNGIQVFEDSVNNISFSNSFNFSWQCSGYDYFYIYRYSQHNYDEEYITDKNYTFYSDSSNYFSIDILPVHGVIPASGATPNVSGDYGYGYVWAEGEGFHFYWHYNTDNIQIQPACIKDKQARAEYYRQKFIELISGK